ncbi:MAG: sugar ABC transporter permease [Anaerolineae bacterium]
MATITARSEPAAVMTKQKQNSLMRQQRIWGWIFLSPWIVGFLAFTLLPIITSLAFSFTNFKLNEPDNIKFIAFDNYVKLFRDPNVGVSLGVTIKFAVISLPLAVILPIALAALLNSKALVGRRFFRTLFYMPYVVPIVSAVYIWSGVLNTETGWINRFLQEVLGVRGPDWLNSVVWIYPALVIIGLWGLGNSYLVTLAAMQNVPTELYEAARVDGANAWRRFTAVTFPMISPVVFFNLVLSTIGLFRYFEIPYILKEGSGYPGNSTYFYNVNFYKETFVFLDMGYGSTLAWLLFIITLVITLFLFYTSRYWVYYASGEVK